MKYTAKPNVVDAFEITWVSSGEFNAGGERTIKMTVAPDIDHHETLSPSLLARQMPTVGDFFVVHANGYREIVTKERFVELYFEGERPLLRCEAMSPYIDG